MIEVIRVRCPHRKHATYVWSAGSGWGTILPEAEQLPDVPEPPDGWTQETVEEAFRAGAPVRYRWHLYCPVCNVGVRAAGMGKLGPILDGFAAAGKAEVPLALLAAALGRVGVADADATG